MATAAPDLARERTRAERCFAVARSTTFDGERDAAVARGIAIAERAGLDLDGFDIPGRAKRQRPRPTAPEFYTIELTQEAMARFRAHEERAQRAAARHEAAWQARYRAMAEIMRQMADLAAEGLRARGAMVIETENASGRRWLYLAAASTMHSEASDVRLVRIASAYPDIDADMMAVLDGATVDAEIAAEFRAWRAEAERIDGIRGR